MCLETMMDEVFSDGKLSARVNSILELYSAVCPKLAISQCA